MYPSKYFLIIRSVVPSSILEHPPITLVPGWRTRGTRHRVQASLLLLQFPWTSLPTVPRSDQDRPFPGQPTASTRGRTSGPVAPFRGDTVLWTRSFVLLVSFPGQRLGFKSSKPLPSCVLRVARAQALRLRVEVVLVASTPGVHEPCARCLSCVVEPLLRAHLAGSGSRFQHAERVPRVLDDGERDWSRVAAFLARLVLVRADSIVVVTIVETGVPAGRHAAVLLLCESDVVADPVGNEGHGVHPGSDLVPLAARYTARTPLSPSCNLALLISSLQLPPTTHLSLSAWQTSCCWSSEQPWLRRACLRTACCCCGHPGGHPHPSARLRSSC